MLREQGTGAGQGRDISSSECSSCAAYVSRYEREEGKL